MSLVQLPLILISFRLAPKQPLYEDISKILVCLFYRDKNMKKVLILIVSLAFTSVIWANEFIAPSLVSIPGGTFLMGSDEEMEVTVKHSPQHRVTVKPFLLSKYEVTVKEFSAFIADTGHQTSSECWQWSGGSSPLAKQDGSWQSSFNAPSEFHPVMCISYNDATAYVTWLSKKTGFKFRLLSEAEWEYAARAGSTTNYFFGNDITQLCDFANVFDQSAQKAFKRDLDVDWDGVNCDDNAEYTAIVGQYKPNAFGLYDMIGNVGELVSDCEHRDYSDAPTDGTSWLEDCYDGRWFGIISVSADHDMFIHRGGSYGYPAWAMSLYVRHHVGKDNTSSMGEGFRIALDSNVKNNELVSQPLVSTQLFVKELARATLEP